MDGIVSSCFVSHTPRRDMTLEMCVTSACTLKQKLKSVLRRPTFHYLVEDSLSQDELTRFRTVADVVDTLPPFTWPGVDSDLPTAERLYSFQKLHVWRLTQYARVLYFDPDVFWVGNPLRYFERYGHAPYLAAAEFKGSNVPFWWSSRKLRYINSGIIILRPSHREHAALLSRLARRDFVSAEPHRLKVNNFLSGRSKVGDQDVIRSHFLGNWTAMDECDNFRGYVKASKNGEGGQARCYPSSIIAYHGARLRGMAPAECQVVHPPPLPKSFLQWVAAKRAAATRAAVPVAAAPVEDVPFCVRERYHPSCM
jgi:hypothetical protein